MLPTIPQLFVLYLSGISDKQTCSNMQNSARHGCVILQIFPNTLCTLSFKIFRSILKEVWLSEETHFVLDCSTENLIEILTQAQQIGLMTNKHHYLITNLDAHILDLEPFQYSETNITAVNQNCFSFQIFIILIQFTDQITRQRKQRKCNENYK